MNTKTYTLVFLSLIGLLALTFGLAYVDLGRLNTPVGLFIAAIKALLVGVVFMQLRWSSPVQRMFSVAGIFWLAILITLSMGDYLTRGWMNLPGHWPG
jgi:cytochrome c oxidase subunit 4